VEQQLGTLYRGGVVVHARWWGCVFVQHEVQSGFGPKLPELSCCGPVLGCKKVEKGDVGLQPPFLCKNREEMGGEWYGEWWWLCLPAGLVPGPLLLLIVFSCSPLAGSVTFICGWLHACKQVRHLVVFGGV